MKQRLWISVLGFVWLSASAHAAILDQVTIKGTVRNIAEARQGSPGYIELKTELGNTVRIPRDAIDENKLSLRPGKPASITVSLKRVVAFNSKTR